MRQAAPRARAVDLAPGLVALAPGLGWIPAARALVAADAHLAYEDVIGGALPLWSTREIVATLLAAARERDAREIVFLGDIVHGARMSDGAARAVAAALDELRSAATVTLVAGNHEGRTRAFAVLGDTHESVERGGWHLAHGDRPAATGERTVIGHLHPCVRLGSGATVPAFLASASFAVLPALTPYSSGLDVLAWETQAALGAWNVRSRDVHVVAATRTMLFPFGALASVGTLRSAAARGSGRRRRLEPDR